MSPLSRLAGPLAAFCWFLFCLGWFDAAAPLRPAWLAPLPAWLPGLAALFFGALWLRGRRGELLGPALGPATTGLLLVVALAVSFRLPLAWWGAWGYTTADGALSGSMALHIRDRAQHDVFIPSEPYSGSLKSYLAAGLSAVSGASLVRSFTLTSVFFYALFVAAAFRLALLAFSPRTALLAGLYAAFAPTFVTWYSLSNDGNYVEVLALGSWALFFACRLLAAEPSARPALALVIGLLLGLGFWCHILAMTHAAAIALAVLVALRAAAVPVLGWMLLGFALGDLPGLLWNATHDWESFRYLVPSGHWEAARPLEATDVRPSLLQRLWLLLRDHGKVLFGYDAGYPAALDALAWLLASLGLLAFLAALVASARRGVARRRLGVDAMLLLFSAANVGAVLFALPHIPGNPRYLLFLFAPACVLVARLLEDGWRRSVLFVLIAFGALGSLGQAQAKLADSFAWQRFIQELRQEGVRYCYTDFYLAARIAFFAEESPLCSSKLGPTTREYFLDFRERVERAPAVDIVAVNTTSADRIERKLKELNVSYERRDLMKPVLLRLSRKVDPRELFPGRDFRPR